MSTTDPSRPAGTLGQPADVASYAEAAADLPEQILVRRAKRERILERGEQAYPVSVPRTHTIAEVRAAHGELEIGEETDVVVGVAGRVVFLRNTGKLCFATVQDGEGNRQQG